MIKRGLKRFLGDFLDRKKNQEAKVQKKTCIITQFCTVANNTLFIMLMLFLCCQFIFATVHNYLTAPRRLLLLFNGKEVSSKRKITTIISIMEFKKPLEHEWKEFLVVNIFFCGSLYFASECCYCCFDVELCKKIYWCFDG